MSKKRSKKSLSFAMTDFFFSALLAPDVSKQGASSHFIIAAILVPESKVKALESGVEIIRKQEFQSGEMKSSSVIITFDLLSSNVMSNSSNKLGFGFLFFAYSTNPFSNTNLNTNHK